LLSVSEIFIIVFQVLFVRSYGILVCGASIEEAFHLAFNVMSAVDIQVS